MLRNKEKETFSFGGKGTVWSWTKIYDPPSDFEKFAPYYVAIIKLEEGPLVTAQLTDIDQEPVIGMPVEMVTRILKYDGDPDTGIVIYGYKFRPPINT